MVLSLEDRYTKLRATRARKKRKTGPNLEDRVIEGIASETIRTSPNVVKKAAIAHAANMDFIGTTLCSEHNKKKPGQDFCMQKADVGNSMAMFHANSVSSEKNKKKSPNGTKPHRPRSERS